MGMRASVRAEYFERAPRTGLVLAVVTLLGVGCAGSDPAASAQPVDVGPCRDGDPDRERWGTNCLCCHANEFGVAGSLVPDAGVTAILVADPTGRTDEMSPDFFDNFFRHQRLTPPLTAIITFADGEQRKMLGLSPHGSCNACHGVRTPILGVR
jgi:hypothetical protein